MALHVPSTTEFPPGKVQFKLHVLLPWVNEGRRVLAPGMSQTMRFRSVAQARAESGPRVSKGPRGFGVLGRLGIWLCSWGVQGFGKICRQLLHQAGFTGPFSTLGPALVI